MSARAAVLVLWWVGVYTAGLAPAARERRRGQIRSDLWEHHADRLDERAGPAIIGLEVLGRAARGAAADLLWRFQLEGPKVQIDIPLERIGGACLLALVAAAMLSLTVNGYDPAVESFAVELRRLASITGWQVATYATLQVLSGLAMVAGAVVLGRALWPRAATLSLLSAAALASAGLLTLATSAIYATAADLADQYVATAPEDSDAVLTTARAFVLVLNSIVPVTSVTLALGVYGFAVITARHHLVPHWLGFVAAASVIALGGAFVAELVDGEVAWLFFMSGFGLLLLWLVAAGASLLLGGSSERTDPSPAA